MSSPKITRMFGFLSATMDAVVAVTTTNAIAQACSHTLMIMPFLSSKHPLPIRLHVDDGPSLGHRLVPRFVQLPDGRGPVVRPLPVGVGVMNDADEPRSAPGRGPLEHLLVGVGVPEREDRSPSDEPLDAHRLSRPVVDEDDLF